MAVIRMLATDLDGTLIGSANEFPFYSDFRQKVQEMRQSDGLIWAACTGRSLSSFREFFAPMRLLGIMPDYVIVNHAYIYSIGRLGYMPHIFWNLRIHYLIKISQFSVSDAIDEWHEMITGVSEGVTTIRRKHNRLCLRFDSEESANVAAELLREKVKSYKHLQVFKYFKELDVRSVPFTKGLALSELAGHLEIPPSEILAIGNGSNDISMMDHNVALYVGCPSNSEDEVIETVHNIGGHVAKKRSLGGVLEVIDAFRNNTVCSDLPEGWIHPSQGDNPSRRLPKGKKRRVRPIKVWLFLAVLYVVLTVFANFGLIPFVSGIIMKPYNMILALLEKIIRLVF